MSFSEYHLTCHGYLMRNSRYQEPFRRIYEITWNASCGKADKIRSLSALSNHWPLYSDPKNVSMISREEMAERWRKAHEVNKQMKLAKNGIINAEHSN